jgi:translation initiation factor IF-3
MNTQTVMANENIRSATVRLVQETGSGIMPTRDALNLAVSQGLDLVAVMPDVQPPVVKIIDLGKYLYEQKQHAKEQARKNRENAVVVKEIQLRPVTDHHDIEIKARAAKAFLEDKCRVRVVVKFRGREMSHTNIGYDIIREFLSNVGEHTLEREPLLQGKAISCLVLPPAKPTQN